MIKFDVLVKDTENFIISKTGEVSIYNTDNLESLSDFIRNTKKEVLLGMVFNTNSVYTSQQGVYLNNAEKKNNMRLVKIGKDNFKNSLMGFTARKLIPFTWVEEYSEFLKPNFSDEKFQLFERDSLVYSLFNNQSGTISNTENNNELFWISVDKMKELADQNGYDELYNDARTSSDRYVYKLLFGEERIYDKLSPDAKAVLDKATELVERSMELRQVMANDENHLNSWDAGYAQLKLVWKEYFQEEFKEFRQLYKALEDRMRPLVYELGFLKK